MEKGLREIDEILASFEDWMHGQDGNECTKARVLIQDLLKTKELPIEIKKGIRNIKVSIVDGVIVVEPLKEKPLKESYGWLENNSFDEEPSGWNIEGGEDAYFKALKEWENQPKDKFHFEGNYDFDNIKPLSKEESEKLKGVKDSVLSNKQNITEILDEEIEALSSVVNGLADVEIGSGEKQRLLPELTSLLEKLINK